MKKLISCLTAVCSAAAIAVPAFAAASFSDVEGTAYEWAQSYIEDMADLGLISGYEDGTFKPQNTVSKIEAISLFARAMGSRSEVNSAAVARAVEQYGEIVDTYNLNFGAEDVAFMMYRGALSQSEADAYLKGNTKNEPMLRYEAATIITKAMGGEEEAKSNLVLDMEYTDVSQIPSAAKKYVYYVTDKKLMSGMGDGTFSPKTSVLRSQIAVMLSNTVEMMEMSFSDVKLVKVDPSSMLIHAKDDDGEEYELPYSEATVFYLEGVKAQARDIPENVGAVVTLNKAGVAFVDVESAIPDEEVYGIFKSYRTANGALSVIITPPNTTESKTYTCKNGITDISKNGEHTTILNLKEGDYVILTIKSGRVEAISAIDKTVTIKAAKIESINYSAANPTITISHTNANYDGMEYEISNRVSVIKDGADADMNSVYRGDEVTLTIEYGVVVKVVANSSKRTIEGTIRQVNIATNPTIVVLVNNEEVTYDVSSNIVITVNGQEGTLYDFRVGDKVTLTTESNAVTRIATTTAQSTSGNLTGEVVNVNTGFSFIKIKTTDTAGSTYEETVYCKDSKTTFITVGGASKQFKDLKEGNVVSVYGTITNGAFEATSVIIVK